MTVFFVKMVVDIEVIISIFGQILPLHKNNNL